MPPPRTLKAVEGSIIEVENIKHFNTGTTIFLTPYSQSPLGNADKVNRTGPGSTPEEPLAFVARVSDSERSALELGGLESAAQPDTTSLEIRYRTFIQNSPTFLSF